MRLYEGISGNHALEAMTEIVAKESAERSYKIHEKRPNISDAIMNGEIQLVINTPIGREGKVDDSYIRKAAIRHRIPYITTMTAALAAAKGVAAWKEARGDVKSLQAYHADLLDVG